MSLQPGDRLGPYQIESLLARGGMGEVYRAEDTRLNRPVAIKVLSSELADESSRRRFQQEAKMASSLNHPHILTVHEAGDIDGRQYLVSEYVDGGTLRDWAKAAPRTWRQEVELIVGVADGLAAAHDVGILHRDIKPENILVTRNGYAKLADFGLAKLEAGRTAEAVTGTLSPQTRPGIVIGTVAYMSPEQAAGQPLDVRSDIFSFGVVLYELVARRRPFAGPTDLEVLQTIIHRAAQPLPASVPPAIRMIVEKAIEKDPADRFQSMRDLVVDLRRVIRLPDDSSSSSSRASLEASRKRAIAIVLALALLVAGAGYLVTRGSPPGRLEYTQLTNFADSVVAPSLSPDGRMLAFIRGADTFMGPGDLFVKLLPDGEPVQLTRDGLGKMGPPVFSPDGSRIAYSIGIHDTWVVPVLGGEPSRMLANAGGLTWIGARRVLFAKSIGRGLHMGLFTSSESRTDERQVYLPTDANGMAHRGFVSPIRNQYSLPRWISADGCLAGLFRLTRAHRGTRLGRRRLSAPTRPGRPTGTGCISPRTPETDSTSGASAFPTARRSSSHPAPPRNKVLHSPRTDDRS